MKAIDILKINRDSSEALGDDKRIIDIYDTAIEELEAIKNRSCKNCIHGNKNMIKDKIVCDVCVSVNRKGMVDKTFYCNKWEVKNEF